MSNDFLVNLSKRIKNLEEQRSNIGGVLGRIELFFEKIGTFISCAFRIVNKKVSDTLTVTDDGVTIDSSSEFSETVSDTPLFRLDYDRLDYGRLSYKGGNVKVTLTLS